MQRLLGLILSTPSGTEDQTVSTRQRNVFLAALLLVALVRGGVLAGRYGDLSSDHDGYLTIARNLVNGHGYCSVPGYPTAFRPPLYPLVAAACLLCGGVICLAVVHLILGVATCALSCRLALNCGFDRRVALTALGLTAIDPLLLRYSALPMTETLFTFLSVLLLTRLTCDRRSFRHSLFTSGIFGAAALCRPSLWAFGILLVLAAGLRILCRRARLQRPDTSPQSQSPQLRRELLGWGIGLTLVMAPWMLRNQIVFGQPIAMTTHGGYTLLLSNNPDFYREVVQSEWGTTWTGTQLRTWQRKVESRLSADGIDRVDELARDAAMRRYAIEWISQHPVAFAQTAALRIVRFWNPVPLVASLAAKVAIGGWYAAMFGLSGVCLWKMRWTRHLILLLVFCVSLTAVHAAYWSNMRMRAPVVPCVAILAAKGLFFRFSRDSVVGRSD